MPVGQHALVRRDGRFVDAVSVEVESAPELDRRLDFEEVIVEEHVELAEALVRIVDAALVHGGPDVSGEEHLACGFDEEAGFGARRRTGSAVDVAS